MAFCQIKTTWYFLKKIYLTIQKNKSGLMKNKIITIILLIGCIPSCKEKTPKKQCEISNIGTFKVINQTHYIIRVEVDGTTPSNMKNIAPDEEASIEVSAGNTHELHIESVPASSFFSHGEFTVDACSTVSMEI